VEEVDYGFLVIKIVYANKNFDLQYMCTISNSSGKSALRVIGYQRLFS